MHQPFFCKGACDLKFWMNRIFLSLFWVKISRLVPELLEKNTLLWGGWKSLPIRTCGHLGYSATCSQPWSRKAANCKTFAWSLTPLLIHRSNLNLQIDVHLMQQLREKSGLHEAPWLRAAAKSQQVWLEDPCLYFQEFLWCFFNNRLYNWA